MPDTLQDDLYATSIDAIAEHFGVTRRAIQDSHDVAIKKLFRAAAVELDESELAAIVDMQTRPRGRRRLRGRMKVMVS